MARSDLAMTLMGGAGIIAIVAPAQAQTTTYNIPRGELRAALATYIRQSGVQLVFRPEDVRGKVTRGVRGAMSPEAALDRLLAGTGLSAMRDADGAVVVAASRSQRTDRGETTESAEAGATPEILVTGQRAWTLNTDIKRSRDDAQPYVVFNREEIQRSGATNLDDFFHDYLNANVAGATQRQTGGYSSRIDLRGLGSDETLVLVDGRRIAPTNTGSGTFDQPDISGIPMASIERIEVLASSASGIYGSNATGGVVNIILKRDYRGLEASATYGGTYDGGGRTRRIDLTGGINLWGGSTNIMATASWRKDDPLFVGDRDLNQRGINRIVANNPALAGTTPPPLGATPNIRSSNGAILTLDPAYGGGSLGSSFTYVPYGYRGVAADGVAALIANAGRYNYDLAPTAQLSSFPTGGSNYAGSGGRTQLLSGQESYAGSIAIRQEVTPWLKAFVEGAASRSSGVSYSSGADTRITLAANAPNNPFQQAISVAVPQIGADRPVHNRTDNFRVTGGLIAKLPFGWNGSAEYSWNRTKFSSDMIRYVSTVQRSAMTAGTIDVLRDLGAYPIDYVFDAYGAFQDQFPSTSKAATLRLAGPLPIRLPGGPISLSLQAERLTVSFPGTRSYLSTPSQSSGSYNPARDLISDSAYVEARFPLIGASNHVPLINELEVQIAGRYERYKIDGSLASINCFTYSRALVAADLTVACPATGTSIARATTSRGAFNPTYSVKWKLTPDLMLRASYANGYRPPDASNLIRTSGDMIVYGITDPERGNEPVGRPYFSPLTVVSGFRGGNADVAPERSRSYTAGAVLTPRGIPGLRLSVDWTKIIKTGNYYQFSDALLSGTAQLLFNDILKAHPERFIRSGPVGSYSVAPITSIDASTMNLSGSTFAAFDYTADYSSKLGRGTLTFSLNATWAYDQRLQFSASSPVIQYAGVATPDFFRGILQGGAEWKGNATLRYSEDRWGIGVRARYFDGYWVNTDHSFNVNQGSASVPSQTFFDVFGNITLFKNTELSAGVRNVFNTPPAFAANFTTLYSRYGDPAGGTYYLTLSRKF